MKSLTSVEKILNPPRRAKALPTLYTSLEPDMRGQNRADHLLRQMRQGFDYDPLAKLMELDKKAAKQNDIDNQFKIAKELMSYVYPKQRSKEVSPDLKDVFDIQVVTQEQSKLLSLASANENLDED